MSHYAYGSTNTQKQLSKDLADNAPFFIKLPRNGESRELVLQVFDSDDNKKNDDEIGEVSIYIDLSNPWSKLLYSNT